ncbi:MAG: ABC transporter ATP-binding protein [Gammaproteobacteria bacterium]|nr:ABC transporter ATP-binding protein [Gammaproteobacteria bacterium]
MSSEPVIRAEGLGKCYHIYRRPQDRLKQALWGTGRRFYREFWALRDASFEVSRGEAIGVVGRNGSGKSTLLQLLTGTLTPTVGCARVAGRVAALLELGSGFSPEFTGRENVYMNGAILGIDRREMEERFDSIAAFADIGEFIDQPVKTYSSGMLVRLAFSVSVSVSPDILIVDEALAVGDGVFQFKCMERIRELVDGGTTLFFVSHDIGMVRSLCDRAIYLDAGLLKREGASETVTEQYVLDLRTQQSHDMHSGAPVVAKPHLGGDDGLAFGTDQGAIRSASFVDTGSQHGIYKSGENIRLEVVVEVDESVDNPALSVIVNDRRMIPVMGRYRALSGHDELRRARILCSFDAVLADGHYFVTLRLEDRALGDVYFVIDKQTGVLHFEILREPEPKFIGLVDVPVEFAEEELCD